MAIEGARAAVDLRGEANDALPPILAEEPFRRSTTCSARTAILERRSRQAAKPLERGGQAPGIETRELIY
ncbi:hypothetical protein ABZT06_09095 [Streptomyces sp. NPDC005483]|uniref:hypothetical protein n=1 Tax=Streptomyces sp. NPDC005483 TaxID=3154882 RepID=UPI0033B82F82